MTRWAITAIVVALTSFLPAAYAWALLPRTRQCHLASTAPFFLRTRLKFELESSAMLVDESETAISVEDAPVITEDDLVKRTLETLDWNRVLEALTEEVRRVCACISRSVCVCLLHARHFHQSSPLLHRPPPSKPAGSRI